MRAGLDSERGWIRGPALIVRGGALLVVVGAAKGQGYGATRDRAQAPQRASPARWRRTQTPAPHSRGPHDARTPPRPRSCARAATNPILRAENRTGTAAAVRECAPGLSLATAPQNSLQGSSRDPQTAVARPPGRVRACDAMPGRGALGLALLPSTAVSERGHHRAHVPDRHPHGRHRRDPHLPVTSLKSRPCVGVVSASTISPQARRRSLTGRRSSCSCSCSCSCCPLLLLNTSPARRTIRGVRRPANDRASTADHTDARAPDDR